MITNYLRELLKPIIYQCMNENELTVSNRYIADMRNINRDLYDIRMSLLGQNGIEIDAKDIADNISAYDIASYIEVDASDIEIDYAELSRHIAGNMDNTIEEADLEVLAHKVVKHVLSHLTANTDYRLWKVERKMDLILNHLGIGAEDLLVYANFEKFHSNEENT